MAKPSCSTWLVYMLRCADGTLYIGITKDLARRCQQHNNGSQDVLRKVFRHQEFES